MKKLAALITAILILFSAAAAADAPAYIGTWAGVFDISQESTAFIMFQLREDHTVLYVYQFFYTDHPGMTDKGVWKWEEIDDHFFRIISDRANYLYYELTDENTLDSGNNIFLHRVAVSEVN